MKYLLLVIALGAAVVLAVLYVPVKDGKPLVEWQQLEKTVKDPSRVMGHGGRADSQAAPTMYRWRDSNGNWQYGDVPPSGVDAQPVKVKPAKSLSPEQIRQGSLEDDQNSQSR